MSQQPQPIESIVKRDGTLVPYDRDRIATAIFKAGASVGNESREEAERLAAEVENALAATYAAPQSVPTVEDIQDVVESILLAKGHPRTARAYIIYRHRRAEAREKRLTYFDTIDNVPFKKIYEVLCWNIDHGCESVNSLNRTVAEGDLSALIHATDRRYSREVELGAELMVGRLPEVRIVIVAGPSSSGKTTTTIKVSEKLAEAGMRFKALAVDNYFFDLEQHPVDEFGDYDYETPQALDLDLINQHLVQLLDGRPVRIPRYDFKTGRRTLDATEMRLEKDEILLIDSLHGLYEGMTAGVPRECKFRLYIETLGQVRNSNGQFMRWADNRLMRRMIRDSWHRQLQPEATITHWHYVRRSELQHIIPYIGSADYIVNSALPYELPILKHKLFHYFPDAMAKYRSDPRRQDAYIRAKRVHEFLQPLRAVEDDRVVPSKSLLREFIGGSDYAY